jgi:hypothetical protein
MALFEGVERCFEPWIPRAAQHALFDRLAESARRLGYTAHVEPERSVQGGARAPVPSMA